jgi:hypothetical protein
MAHALKPTSTYGNTFATQVGSTYPMHSSGVNPYGDIDYGSLNKVRFTEHVQFNKFYEIIKDSVMSRLGAPVIRVELTDHQVLTCIDEAITKLDYHAPNWCTNFMTFTASGGHNLYELPPFVMHNLQYVVYKKTLLAVAAAQGSLEFDFFIKYFQDNFLFKDFQISDFLIMIMHLEQIRKILSREGSWEVVGGKYLMLFPVPTQLEEVIVQFRCLNSDSLHPFWLGWLQRFSSACAKIILGGIRGKYDTLPSPGGGARLNGDQLVEEGNAEKQILTEELLTEIEEPPCFTAF